MEEKRSFSLGKKDWLILVALAVLALGAWVIWQIGYEEPSEQNLAIISVDGEEVIRLDLLTEPDRIFSIEEEYGVPASFEIKEGKIRFVDVTCPDHICENTGFVHMEGQTAVCMPNRTSLSIYGQ